MEPDATLQGVVIEALVVRYCEPNTFVMDPAQLILSLGLVCVDCNYRYQKVHHYYMATISYYYFVVFILMTWE